MQLCNFTRVEDLSSYLPLFTLFLFDIYFYVYTYLICIYLFIFILWQCFSISSSQWPLIQSYFHALFTFIITVKSISVKTVSPQHAASPFDISDFEDLGHLYLFWKLTGFCNLEFWFFATPVIMMHQEKSTGVQGCFWDALELSMSFCSWILQVVVLLYRKEGRLYTLERGLSCSLYQQSSQKQCPAWNLNSPAWNLNLNTPACKGTATACTWPGKQPGGM